MWINAGIEAIRKLEPKLALSGQPSSSRTEEAIDDTNGRDTDLHTMNRMSPGCLALILTVGLCGAGAATAQTTPDRAVELFTCKDVMREPNTSRDVAIAFLHGYLLGKSGDSKFNVEILEKQTSSFIEECLDNPQGKAADVLAKLKK
jgi:hypothetical protein